MEAVRLRPLLVSVRRSRRRSGREATRAAITSLPGTLQHRRGRFPLHLKLIRGFSDQNKAFVTLVDDAGTFAAEGRAEFKLWQFLGSLLIMLIEAAPPKVGGRA